MEIFSIFFYEVWVKMSIWFLYLIQNSIKFFIQVGRGIYFPGETGALIEAVSTEMYNRNPEKFNWMYPGVSPKGTE